MLPRPLDDCLSQLRRLGQPETLQDDSEVEQIARAAAAALIETENIDEESVAQLVRQHPDWIPVLASCVGLGREQLKRQLQYRLGTAGWVKLAKSSSHRLVHALEEAFGLLGAIREQKSSHGLSRTYWWNALAGLISRRPERGGEGVHWRMSYSKLSGRRVCPVK